MRTIVFVLWLLGVTRVAECSNILIVHMYYTASHLLTLRTAGEYFARQGHQVHYLRWKEFYNPPMPHPNMTETVLSINNEDGYFTFLTKEKQGTISLPLEDMMEAGIHPFRTVPKYLLQLGLTLQTYCDHLVSNKELIHNLKMMKFDLAIVDLIANECALGLMHHLGLPTVGFWGIPFTTLEASFTTAYLPPSHVPSGHTGFKDEMNFLQRLANFGVHSISQVGIRLQCTVSHYIINKHLPGTPNPCTLLKELNGMLINIDNIMDHPQLLPPTFVRVGGLHLKEVAPLPEDLEEWMQSSGEHGVVLFSIGHMVNPKVLRKSFVQAFFQAASKLPQKFIMKLEGDLGPVPENVKVMERIPQQDILAHNKTKLFVTHCGPHGAVEGIFYGVPMIGMPLMMDQWDNFARLEKFGVALKLDRETNCRDTIYHVLRDGLHDTTLKNNVKNLSTLMRDVRQSPQEKALELIEYLIRNRGAPHLKISSRHLNNLQYFSIDVFLFLGAVCYVLFYLLKMAVRLVFKKVSVPQQNFQVCLEVKKVL